MEQPLSYRVRIQIYKGEKCFGPGIAELLTRVQETGSLRAGRRGDGPGLFQSLAHGEKQRGRPGL